MSYHRLVILSVFLAILLIPLYFAYNYFGKVIQYTGIVHPNVVLITIDTCQYGALGSYGNPDVYTPFMDRLSRRGLLFPKGYAS
ncbi:sulfatase-like hydrolase/transferase, partial [bacterium]|nr:sulfatase-like hydrolase/transferase [bacterium]